MEPEYDLLIRDGRDRGGKRVDVGIREDRIREVGSGLSGEAKREIDAGGRLVSPPLIEPHTHLDAALTEGEAGHNQSGGLLEGIRIWSQRKQRLTREGVKRRATEAIRWYVAHGTLYIRSHVDVCDPDLTALKALLEVQRECSDLVDLQLVAFPQEGIPSFEGGEALLEEALKAGCDLVGAIPHYEMTRDMGVQSLRTAFELARKYDRPIDAHCDETDDEQSRFLEELTALTLKNDMQGRVSASHTTAMHSYNDAYMFKLYGWLRKADMNMVANPLTNILTSGVFDHYPKRRGIMRVKELLEKDINVCFGEDCVLDPWYPMGVGDLLQAAFMGLHIAQMSGYDEIPRIWDAITENTARALGVQEEYGLEEGTRADLVVFDATNIRDTLRIMPPVRWVIKSGNPVAETTSPETTLYRGGKSEPVDFVRDGGNTVNSS